MKSSNRMTFRFDHSTRSAANSANLESSTAGQAAVDKEVNDSTSLFDEPSSKKREVNDFFEKFPKTGADAGGKVVPLYGKSPANTIEEAHPWNSPYQDDIGALEELIRDFGRPDPDIGGDLEEKERNERTEGSERIEGPLTDEHELSWRDDARETPFDKPHGYEWSGTGNMGVRHASASASYRRRNPSPSWMNVTMSVAGALLTGALFGYLMLSLFVGPQLWPGAGGTPAPSNTSSGVDAIPSSGKADGENGGIQAGGVGEEGGASGGDDTQSGGIPVDAGAMVSLKADSASYTMLQYGVFSQPEGRDMALSELTGQKLPAAAYKGESEYRVFAGIADDGDMADRLIKRLPDLLLYKKTVTVETPAQMPFDGKAVDAEAYFGNSKELLAMWCSLTDAQLEQNSFSSLGTAAANAWKEKYDIWKGSSAAMKEGLRSEGVLYYEKMSDAMSAAADALSRYDKNPGETAIREVQQNMMAAVLAQKEWFESLSAL